MKMISAFLSKPGGREINQDAIGFLPAKASLGCWVVADGRSELAAKQAVQEILDNFEANPAISQPVLVRVMEWVQKHILVLQATQQSNVSLSSAVAIICAGGLSALWAHVGNVRIYVFRNGEIISQTKDHSVSQALVDAGKLSPAEIRTHEERRLLLRSLGTPGGMRPSILENRFKLLPDDLFLICTDGFWEYVTELEMQADWCKSGDLHEWLQRMEMRILLAAPPDHDNYSAIALMAEP